MHLGFVRRLLGELRKDFLGDALGALALEGALAAKAMTLYPPKTFGHELVGSAIMLFRLFEFALGPEPMRFPDQGALFEWVPGKKLVQPGDGIGWLQLQQEFIEPIHPRLLLE